MLDGNKMNYKNRIMVQLTTEMAKMWKAGKWKYSYTNINMYNRKLKGFLAVSGRYFYIIDFIKNNPKGDFEIVSFKNVPKTYQKYVNPNKIIYKVPSKLVRIEKREGCK